MIYDSMLSFWGLSAACPVILVDNMLCKLVFLEMACPCVSMTLRFFFIPHTNTECVSKRRLQTHTTCTHGDGETRVLPQVIQDAAAFKPLT